MVGRSVQYPVSTLMHLPFCNVSLSYFSPIKFSHLARSIRTKETKYRKYHLLLIPFAWIIVCTFRLSLFKWFATCAFVLSFISNDDLWPIHNVRSIRSMMKLLHLLSFPDWVLEFVRFFSLSSVFFVFFFPSLSVPFYITTWSSLRCHSLLTRVIFDLADCEKCSFLNLIDIFCVYYSAIECYSDSVALAIAFVPVTLLGHQDYKMKRVHMPESSLIFLQYLKFLSHYL